MEVDIILATIFFILSILTQVKCAYPPTGEEVQMGSVLLPASRRGRYLANIVRRQAVDGTGIKFNKDADRMNAEAKKKVDVLSEELLPYIIAEQERRTTLHKRIMTAIQNGEKGVTIAEIRNKPPLIIRKGLMYRCPSNRAPKEPDGSGVLMCEDDIVPTQVMYDSCLSAEDKELYNADNRFFFCNRHRVEGPDLPRNGSTVIGCAPIERTSLNYTTGKCTLEDTEDIVVHYRYYPDRTYKFVTELDPDHEVCDHWNPCQIGYIYSLPSPDQAMPASDLWRDTPERPEDYERDEIVPPVPEDSPEEAVFPSIKSYVSSPRKIDIPPDHEFVGIRMKDTTGAIKSVNEKHWTMREMKDTRRSMCACVIISLMFSVWKAIFYGVYYAIFKHTQTQKERYIRFISFTQGAAYVVPKSAECIHGQHMNSTLIPFKCNRCHVQGVMVRSPDFQVFNVDPSHYRMKEFATRQGKPQQYMEVDLECLKPSEFGDYFMIIQNGDGMEERVKLLTVQSPEKDVDNEISIKRLESSVEVGGHYDRTMNYSCTDCEATNILCNGESVLALGRVSIIPVTSMISFNFPRFENDHCCVYMGFFKGKEKVYKKVLAVIENNSPSVTVAKVPVLDSPKENSLVTQEVSFTCDDCTVEKVFVNGLELEQVAEKSTSTAQGVYSVTSSSITIMINEFSDTYEGYYQAMFTVGGELVTKNIMIIKDPTDTADDDTDNQGGDTTASVMNETETTTSTQPPGR